MTPGNYVCCDCLKLFDCLEAMQRHNEEVHSPRRCTYCDEDGVVRCGGLPPLECPVCFGSKHDYRDEKQRERDPK